jgi:hypothetical protein
MHDPKSDGVMIEHRLKHASDSALFGPDLAADGLLIPEVPPIRARHTVGVFGRIGPGCRPLQRAGFIDDPFPRDEFLLARFLEQAIDGINPAVNSL